MHEIRRKMSRRARGARTPEAPNRSSASSSLPSSFLFRRSTPNRRERSPGLGFSVSPRQNSAGLALPPYVRGSANWAGTKARTCTSSNATGRGSAISSERSRRAGPTEGRRHRGVGTDATRAARGEMSSIPIVMGAVSDPVGFGVCDEPRAAGRKRDRDVLADTRLDRQTAPTPQGSSAQGVPDRGDLSPRVDSRVSR